MRLASSTSIAFTAIFPTLFLGFAASVQLIAFFIYFGVQPDWLVTALFFIITSGTYLLNRISDKEDKFNNVLRWRFFNLNQGRTFFWLAISVCSLTIPVFILIAFQKYNTSFLFASISIIGFIYTVKILPIMKNYQLMWISLKDIPVGKNFIVCLIWAGSALVIAASFLNIKHYQFDLIILFLTFFIGNCNSTITSDARDVVGDQLRNIKTLPGLIGLRHTFLILTTINVFGLITTAVCFILGSISLELTLLSLVIILWAGLSTIPQYFFSGKLSKNAGELLVDSHLLISALGLIIVGSLH